MYSVVLRFFYGNGKLVAEVCCTSLVYSAEKKQTKIEFPEARFSFSHVKGL
jgi:hypothetical protein